MSGRVNEGANTQAQDAAPAVTPKAPVVECDTMSAVTAHASTAATSSSETDGPRSARTPKGRVLVAMSGGVDSSVVARLLVEQGYECLGATMRLATNEDDRPGERTCCSTDDVADARSACWDAGIRHRTFDYTREFARDVIDPFVAAYEAGLTPNPCVACNRHLKFGALLERARELGCDYLATGHYARVTHDERGYHLLKGVDAAKDQSYFLFGLTQERLAHVMFPLGGMRKDPEVRELAEGFGLVAAHKKDSEGICFVPEGDHLRFIEQRTGRKARPGDVLDTEGNVLGTHQGALRYTLGQRKGLGVACARPVYVCAIDTEANTVTLGDEDRLMASSLVACDWNWVSGVVPSGPVEGGAKVRYHQPDQACVATPLADGRVRVEFERPQRAITPGQAVVFYQGDELIGGGTIESVG